MGVKESQGRRFCFRCPQKSCSDQTHPLCGADYTNLMGMVGVKLVNTVHCNSSVYVSSYHQTLIMLACLWILGHIVVKGLLDVTHVAGVVHQDDLLQQFLRGADNKNDGESLVLVLVNIGQLRLSPLRIAFPWIAIQAILDCDPGIGNPGIRRQGCDM